LRGGYGAKGKDEERGEQVNYKVEEKSGKRK